MTYQAMKRFENRANDYISFGGGVGWGWTILNKYFLFEFFAFFFTVLELSQYLADTPCTV